MKPYFGVRAHDFGTLPVEELALKIAASGAECIQLALAKAFPGDHLMPEEFGEEKLIHIRETFKKYGITVAVIGCYIDTVTKNSEEREFGLKRFESHIDHAAYLGCNFIGTETGSPIPYLSEPNGRESAFAVATESLRRIVRYAEKTNVIVSIEAVAHHHALQSAQQVKFLLEEFKSPNLGVIFDPVNLVPPEGVENIDVFLDECFACVGNHIVALHAKDYRMEDTDDGKRKSKDLPAGTGEMDWVGVFRRLIQHNKQHVPILLEDTGPSLAPDALKRMQIAWDEAKRQLNV